MNRFSSKQKKVLSWWYPQSSYDGIICDGAVRSGKTLCMTLSFLIWSMACFDRKNFAICGKTISSVRRNVIVPVRELLSEMGFEMCIRDRIMTKSISFFNVCSNMLKKEEVYLDTIYVVL